MKRGQIERATEALERYAREAKAPSTRRTYKAGWNAWRQWCKTQGAKTLPASSEALALWASHLADSGRSPATVDLYLTAVSQAHSLAGYLSPVDGRVRTVVKGIRRDRGATQARKAPLTVEHLRGMLDHVPTGPKGSRDRAILLLGFAGAFRRSEMASLNVSDLEVLPEGIVVHLRTSKTDQEGHGRKVGIPHGSNPLTCPVRATLALLEHYGEGDTGPLFRSISRGGRWASKPLSAHSIGALVKSYAQAIGMDPSTIGGHSLRAGHATEAARHGVEERAIMAQGGWTSTGTVRRYIRDGSLFRSNSAMGLGL